MIGLQITGATEVIEKLGALPEKVRVTAKSSLDMWALELAGYIKADKLSGSPLNWRSGSLSNSVYPTKADAAGSTISAGARAGLDVPYAKIHEYGGVIPAHVVVARNAKALAFTVGGITRFAKSVQIPAINMPERSYMRSALQDKAPDGIAELRAAVKEAIAA